MNNKEALRVCKESAKHWDEIITTLKEHLGEEAIYIPIDLCIKGNGFSLHFGDDVCPACQFTKENNRDHLLCSICPIRKATYMDCKDLSPWYRFFTFVRNNFFSSMSKPITEGMITRAMVVRDWINNAVNYYEKPWGIAKEQQSPFEEAIIQEAKKSHLNEDALEDLYKACKNALGAYKALKLLDVDKHLPGYKHCLEFLKAAICKAEENIRIGG